MLVDDDRHVLEYVKTVLLQAGFHVLSAHSGPAAVLVAKEAARIDLLLSDVDMPEMSGPDLGQEMRKSRSDMRVMLMSGGPSGNLLVLNHGWAFIQKPFVPDRLVEMVKDVLAEKIQPQASGQEFDTRKANG